MIFNSYHAKSFTRLLQLCLNNQVFEVERIFSLDVFLFFFKHSFSRRLHKTSKHILWQNIMKYSVCPILPDPALWEPATVELKALLYDVDTLVTHCDEVGLRLPQCIPASPVLRTYSTIQPRLHHTNTIIFRCTESFSVVQCPSVCQTSGKRGASQSLTQSHQQKPEEELRLSAWGLFLSSAVGAVDLRS